MNKKSKKAQRKKIIEQNPPLYLSEGHWEKGLLELMATIMVQCL